MKDAARLLQLQGVVVDLIYEVEALPRRGTEAIVTGFRMTPGGGFNAMVAARRSGMRVSYGGGIGGGPLGALVAGSLQAEGIAALVPRAADHDQGCATVMVEPDGERTFVAAPGAESVVTAETLGGLQQPAFDWSLLSGYALHYERSRDAFYRWLSGDAPIPSLVFDPSPIVAALLPEMLEAALSRALWISANEAEAAVLTGHTDPAEAARHLSRHRPEGGGAIVRCGARGCVIATAGAVQAVRGHRVGVLDTNGAGDAHLGSFVAALSRGQAPRDAARYANVAAALSTTLRGPATAPDRKTVERVLQASHPPHRHSEPI